jgi:hypothetical protein
MKRPHAILFSMLFLLRSGAVLADVYSVSFLSTSSLESPIESSTAVVNTALGYIHPPIQVDGWQVISGPAGQVTQLNLGDGSDGIFDVSTYLNFNSGAYNNDQVIHINTDQHPALNFQSFDLAVGWTIRPSGSQPLVIRSLSTLTVSGTIDCSGGSGQGLNSTNTIVSLGGTGTCGGGSGGNGASVAISATAGSQSGSNTLGPGLPGTVASAGGGGGGAYSQAISPPGNGAPGTAGANQEDDAFIVTGGGAGGGGGGVYNNLSDIPNLSSGGGGGAGGGSIYLIAAGDINIPASGVVNASGGIGGGLTATGKGGAGGGGGGGSVLIMSLGVLTVDGAVSAINGNAGVSDGGNGGAGATGRTWLTDSTGARSGSATENPTNVLASVGSIDYTTGTFTATSSLIDTVNSHPLFTNATSTNTTPGGSSVNLQVAADDSSFSASSANWISAASVSTLSGHRYFRYFLTLTSVSTTAPPTVSAVQITYSKTSVDQFDFKTGCGLVKTNNSGGSLDRPPNGPTVGPPNVSAFAVCLFLFLPLLITVFERIHGSRIHSHHQR